MRQRKQREEKNPTSIHSFFPFFSFSFSGRFAYPSEKEEQSRTDFIPHLFIYSCPPVQFCSPPTPANHPSIHSSQHFLLQSTKDPIHLPSLSFTLPSMLFSCRVSASNACLSPKYYSFSTSSQRNLTLTQ